MLCYIIHANYLIKNVRNAENYNYIMVIFVRVEKLQNSVKISSTSAVSTPITGIDTCLIGP